MIEQQPSRMHEELAPTVLKPLGIDKNHLATFGK